jgi:glycosyltransferase involved in cell wall biosynthesis
VGRLVPEKAPHLAMEAVLALRREGTDVRMSIVGAHDFGRSDATPYVRSLERLAATDPGAFELVGYVDHRRLPDVLRRHDVYVHACTWDEPFGLTTVEAMACGLAPVVSARGANAEVVGPSGRVVEPEPAAVADALRSLGSDPEALASSGRRARERAVLRFSWDRVAAEYFDRIR